METDKYWNPVTVFLFLMLCPMTSLPPDSQKDRKALESSITFNFFEVIQISIMSPKEYGAIFRQISSRSLSFMSLYCLISSA